MLCKLELESSVKRETQQKMSQPKPSRKEVAKKQDEGPVYENSTRIPVVDFYQRIQEEKMRSPDHPFRDEFLVRPPEYCFTYYIHSRIAPEQYSG